MFLGKEIRKNIIFFHLKFVYVVAINIAVYCMDMVSLSAEMLRFGYYVLHVIRCNIVYDDICVLYQIYIFYIKIFIVFII